MGEDQDAAGARGLDEAHRGDRLAGAGGVLEPEAPRRAGVLGRGLAWPPPPRPPRPGPSRAAPRRRRLLVALELDLAGGQLLDRRVPSRWRRCAPFCISEVSAISVPDRASTWCALSVVPSARCGSSSESSRSSPSISEYSRRHSTEGSLAAGLDLRERVVERAPAGRARRQRPARRPPLAARSGSRANSSARERSSPANRRVATDRACFSHVRLCRDERRGWCRAGRQRVSGRSCPWAPSPTESAAAGARRSRGDTSA